MRFRTIVVAGLTLVWSSFGASASIISQGVTFTFEDLGGNSLRLTIDNILNATGNWAPVTLFDAFDVRDVGTFTGGTATFGAQTEVGVFDQVTGASTGCNNGGSGICFDWTPNLTLTNHMVIDIAFTAAGALDFS